MRKLLNFLMRLIIAILVVGTIIVLTQDVFLVPAAVNSLLYRNYPQVPEGINSYELLTSDGKHLEIWELKQKPQPSKGAAIFFHGNGETVFNSMYTLQWFYDIGYSAYAIDYRGFGRSTGWPFESGLYIDADTVTDHVLDREKISANQLLLLGASFGTGIAAYETTRVSPRALILFSPYLSIPEVVKEREYFKYLVPFVHLELPTQKYILKVQNSCIFLAHGERDDVITARHSRGLSKLVEGREKTWTFIDPEADHGNVFPRNRDKIAALLPQCE